MSILDFISIAQDEGEEEVVGEYYDPSKWRQMQHKIIRNLLFSAACTSSLIAGDTPIPGTYTRKIC